MPILKLTHKVQKSGLTVKIASAVLDDLKRYSEYTNAGTNEIVQQALAYVFEKDGQFHKWKEQQVSVAPPAKAKPSGMPIDKPGVVPTSKPHPGSGIAS
jgi:hypothetical protein